VQAFFILIGAGASPAAGGGGCAGFKWVRAEDVLDDKTILEMDPEGDAEKCVWAAWSAGRPRAGEKLITDREAAKERSAWPWRLCRRRARTRGEGAGLLPAPDERRWP
jgi:hypothetical protein